MRHRSAIVGVAAAALLVLAGCSASGNSDEGTSDPAPTEQTDEQAVEDLVDRYWSAIVRAQNTADTSPGQFANVATGAPVEAMLGRLQHYANIGLVRVGEPEITDVEVQVNGSSATVVACLNEDDWSATLKGVPELPPKLGPKPWGATAAKSDDSWLIVETTNAPEGSPAC